MKTRRFRFFRNQRGQEILEFAIVLPLFALLLAGVIEFGKAFFEYNILTKSVRDTARYVSAARIYSTGDFPVDPDPDVVAQAKNLAVYGNISGKDSDGNALAPILPGLSPGDISVSSNVVGTGEIYVTVSATYRYQALFRFLLPGSTFRPKETMIFLGLVSYPSTK